MPTPRTGSPLLEYAPPRSVLFQPSKTYMRSTHRFFGLPPQASTPPQVSTSGHGGATPMPDRTSSSTPAWDPSSSSTPAWDPSSRTPRYSYFYFG